MTGSCGLFRGRFRLITILDICPVGLIKTLGIFRQMRAGLYSTSGVQYLGYLDLLLVLPNVVEVGSWYTFEGTLEGEYFFPFSGHFRYSRYFSFAMATALLPQHALYAAKAYPNVLLNSFGLAPGFAILTQIAISGRSEIYSTGAQLPYWG